MKRLKYFIGAATIIGVFTSLHGGIFDAFRDFFFPQMKLNHPVLVAFLSSAIISTVAFAIIIGLGLLLRWRDRRQKQEEIRQKQEEIRIVKQWFSNEAARLLESMIRLVQEINIEIGNHGDCKRRKKAYNWSAWKGLVNIWELVKGSSGLCNIGSDQNIEMCINHNPELLVLKEDRQSIIAGWDRVYRFISNSGSKDIVELHRALVVIEDVRDTHIGQIVQNCSGDSLDL